MKLSKSCALGSIALVTALSAGCDTDGNNKSPLRENIEGTIGEPQKGTGVLGGNAAPLLERDAGTPRAAAPDEADAGADAGDE